MNRLDKIKYWSEKIPELRSNLEPLTQLMIRTCGEVIDYVTKNKNKSSIKIVDSAHINLLHSIDRATAIKKLLDRVNFLRINKKEIKELERKDGFVDLTSDFFINSQFKSINSEIIAEVGHKKYMTLSGVGRICAVKIVFPEGIRMKIQVNSIDNCLHLLTFQTPIFIKLFL